jgi:hypothetical protein
MFRLQRKWSEQWLLKEQEKEQIREQERMEELREYEEEWKEGAEAFVTWMYGVKTRLGMNQTQATDDLAEHMRIPLSNGKVTWPVDWKFNACMREIHAGYYGKNQQWSKQVMKDLELFKREFHRWM